ncbi:MAG: DUF1523 family protein [Pseudomonadota bacterium]
MNYVKWTIFGVLASMAAAFLHYSLPDREIVKIVGTEVVRIETELSDGTLGTIDQQRINTRRQDGSLSVFRNNDTDWGWPPYFKFDTADLQASAQVYGNESEADKVYVVVQHYGWRLPWFSMFPNAISIREADGPDETLIPWFNIVFVTLLIIALLFIRRMLILLFDRHVTPVIDTVDTEIEETSDAISARYRGVTGWFRRFF